MPKPFFLLAAALWMGLALSVSHAQESATSSAPPQSAATPSPGNAALFPEGGAQTPGQSANARGGGRRSGQGRGGGRRNRSGDATLQQADTAPLEVRVAYRRAKTTAMLRDPGLADLLVQAEAARTDDVKRSYLRTYYTRLYALVQKVDPSPAIKDYVKLLSQVSEQRYDPKRHAVNGEDSDLISGRGGRGGGRRQR